MPTITKNVKDELLAIKRDIAYIKGRMVDIDGIMTEDDYKALLNYRKEKSKRTLSSHKNLKKELGL